MKTISRKPQTLLLSLVLLSLTSGVRSEDVLYSSSLSLEPFGDSLRLDGALELHPKDPSEYDGGFSGLWVSKDCSRLITVSDYSQAQLNSKKYQNLLHLSHWYEANIEYDQHDTLLKISEVKRSGPIKDESGNTIVFGTEGIAAVGDNLLISFDHRDALLLFKVEPFSLNGTPNNIVSQGLSNWPKMDQDKGAEAVTALDDNHLLVIHEKSSPNVNHPSERYAWIVDIEDGSSKQIVYQASLTPKGAETLSNGDVLILEKKFSDDTSLTQVRVVLLPKNEIDAAMSGKKQLLSGNTILDATKNYFDNFEGIAACQRRGKQYVFLISDNNGDWPRAMNKNRENPQRTLLLRFKLVTENI